MLVALLGVLGQYPLVVGGYALAADRSMARRALPHPPADIAERSTGGRNTLSLENICGASNLVDVEFYEPLGEDPASEMVQRASPSTVQLRWRTDITDQYSGPGQDPGNINGAPWCSGTLIGPNLVLTAAHCLRVQYGDEGWITPSTTIAAEGRVFVAPSELAKLLTIRFNYQVANPTHQLRETVVYSVEALVETGDQEDSVQGERLDYAILRVDRDSDGAPPGARFPIAELDVSEEGLRNAGVLTIVQHPNGWPKMLAFGRSILEPRDVLLRYEDLDTLGASSGAGILDQRGRLIGVHTNGGCGRFSGYNFGVTLRAISSRSAIVH